MRVWWFFHILIISGTEIDQRNQRENQSPHLYTIFTTTNHYCYYKFTISSLEFAKSSMSKLPNIQNRYRRSIRFQFKYINPRIILLLEKPISITNNNLEDQASVFCMIYIAKCQYNSTTECQLSNKVKSSTTHLSKFLKFQLLIEHYTRRQSESENCNTTQVCQNAAQEVF